MTEIPSDTITAIYLIEGRSGYGILTLILEELSGIWYFRGIDTHTEYTYV